jgi:hypothetical protein
MNRMRAELEKMRQQLSPADDGCCDCSDEPFVTVRDETDLTCSRCNRPYRHPILEVIVQSCEELEAFRREHQR